MKTKLTLSILLLTLFFSFEKGMAQAPGWQWAKSWGATVDGGPTSIATDADGNSYVTGTFDSPSITFGSFTLINNGGYEFYIVKYDTAGNVIWAKSEGGTADEGGYGISTDASGNIYVTGGYASTSITFGSFTLNSMDTNSYYGDIFIVKYDPTGNVIWAKSAGGTGNDWGYGIKTDPNGNSYVTGAFASPTVSFGSFSLSNQDTSGIYNDVFIVKYDSAGNVIWAKSGGGAGYDKAFSIAIDSNGNGYVTGIFDNPSITFGSFTLNNNGVYNDIFIVKYDPAGNVIWAKGFGGTDDDNAFSIATDADGNSYVTGAFGSPIITFGSFTLINNGIYNVFTAKFDTAGNVIWAKGAGGTGVISFDHPINITTDASGNSYVSGEFLSPSITFGTFTFINNGYYDLFIVKYDSAGNVIWAKSAGGSGWDLAISATDNNGNIYVAGQFLSPSITLGSTTLINNNSNSEFALFIAKISDVPTGINENPYGDDLNIYPNPATDYITINTGINKKQVITITDITGKIIYSTTTLSEKTIINTKDFPQGVYAVQVQAGDAVQMRKVIVVR